MVNVARVAVEKKENKKMKKRRKRRVMMMVSRSYGTWSFVPLTRSHPSIVSMALCLTSVNPG